MDPAYKIMHYEVFSVDYSFARIATSKRERSNDVIPSASEMPDHDPASDHGEDEPLLGEPGDASQKEQKGIQFNFIIGRYSRCGLA